jgi:hypothetical protein
VGVVTLSADISSVEAVVGVAKVTSHAGDADIRSQKCRGAAVLDSFGAGPVSFIKSSGIGVRLLTHLDASVEYPDPPPGGIPCEFLKNDTIEVATTTILLVGVNIVTWRLHQGTMKTKLNFGFSLGLGFSLIRFKVTEAGPI